MQAYRAALDGSDIVSVCPRTVRGGSSLFSMKPILKASEIDDSRPTVVRVMNDEPKLVSVLSGKINTVYDLDEVLDV